jgi:4-hydroxy-2-oxoheptanedioate aldolase
MIGNRLRRLWAERPVFGAWCTIPSPAMVEVMLECGFDFLAFDCQHGEFGVTDLEPLLRVTTGTDITPVVRVPTNDYYAIGHALDAGAAVVIVPMVESAAAAVRAAAASRFYPDGTRSYSHTRAARILGAEPELVNREVACLVMVETAKGVRNVAEIASAPGVDGIFVGPADLGLTLGVPPGTGPLAAEVERAIDEVVVSCQSAGVLPGMHGGSEYAGRGLRFLTVASDRGLLGKGRDVAAAALQDVQRLQPGPHSPQPPLA